MNLTKRVIEKTKEHFNRNKKEYLIGGICFVAGSAITRTFARPSIGKFNVYNITYNEQRDSDKAEVLEKLKL